MNAAHWHLLVNHLPILGVPFGLGLLVASAIRLNVTLQRAAFVVFVLAAAGGGVAYLSGEPAEERLERAGIDVETLVEDHEEAAEAGLVSLAALAVLATGGLWRARRAPLGRVLVLSLAVGAAGVGATLGWVANLGGRIRHSEIRSVSLPGSPGEDGEDDEEDSDAAS